MITGGGETKGVMRGARRGSTGSRIEGGDQPLNALGLDQHHVEAAGRRGAQRHQVVPRGEHEAALLHAGDAAAGPAMAAACALAHLDEDQRAVARVAHDQVDLAAAAAGGSIIARDQAQAGLLQMRQRGVFRRVAALLGRPAPCRLVVVLEKSH